MSVWLCNSFALLLVYFRHVTHIVSWTGASSRLSCGNRLNGEAQTLTTRANPLPSVMNTAHVTDIDVNDRNAEDIW